MEESKFNMYRLSELAEHMNLSKNDQRYYFGMMREHGLLEIIGKLCQQAYDLGYDDCEAEYEELTK